MGLFWEIGEADGASAGSSQSQQFAAYRARAPLRPGKVLRLKILRLHVEIPIPAPQSVAFLLPIILLHTLLLWVIANSDAHALARVIVPLAVKFMPSQEHEVPPEPPMLPAAALELETDPLRQILPPSITIDAFESKNRAITTSLVAPKKSLPEPTIADTVEEEEGTFVRPRPIRRRMPKQRYPPGAAAAGESGRATVKICITARGTVDSVEIIESTGFERLDNDALDVARQYRFRPATRNDKAIPVCMPYSVNYRIK